MTTLPENIEQMLHRLMDNSKSELEIVRALADENASGTLGQVATHFFSFGGIAATSKWAAHAAAGKITFEGEGFTVEP